MRKTLAIALSALALTSCYRVHERELDSDEAPWAGTDGRSDSTCIDQSLRAGEKYAPVDMVWVVDSSRSMRDQQSRIRATINEFVQDAQARNYDVRLVMITNEDIVPDPLGSDANRYRFIQREVESNEPLSVLIEALPRYRDFLRADAALHFVAVTDDESALSAGDFQRQIQAALQRPYTFHAVVSPDVDGMPCQVEMASQTCSQAGNRRGICGAAAIGTQYLTLAEESGGESISICIDDWREVFGPLLEAVTPTSIPCAINLPQLDAFALAEVELIQDGAAALLQRVPSAAACAMSYAFYLEPRGDGPVLTLCPAACAATSAAGVELHVRVDCD
jgi:hypothetical protein